MTVDDIRSMIWFDFQKSIITYPTISSEDEWKTICEIYEKKMDKIIGYHQNFIFCNEKV